MNSAQSPAQSTLCRYALLLLLILLPVCQAVAASTTTTVISSQSPITLGGTVTFTATVTAAGTPTGLVTFFDGATPLGSGTLAVVLGNDQATFSTSLLSASGSPHSITATYQGDASFTASTSSAISETVNPRTTTTGVVLNPTTVAIGQPSTATVTVTDGGSSAPPGIADTFSPTGAPATSRSGFTATLFADGKVLVAGGTGTDVNNTVLQSAEIYSVSSAAFTATGNLNTARSGAAAVLLPNGKILVAGGSTDSTPVGALNTAELFDPNTGTFTTTGTMNAARFGALATLLNNGQVLLAGGGNSGGFLNSAELYNPATGVFTATGSMTTLRPGASATLLGSGKVLFAGGSSTGNAEGALSSAELFDPTAGTFTAIASSLSVPRWEPAAALLLSGKVLIAGGQNPSHILTSADLYDPVANTFSATAHQMAQARVNGSAVALPNGMVLLAGGVTPASTVAELYDADGDKFDATGSLQQSDNVLVATLLNDGDVLVVGLTAAATPASDAELYSPSFNPLGIVGFSSSEATDTFGGPCVLAPNSGSSTASACTSTVTATNIGASPHIITSSYPADAVHSLSSNTASLTVNAASTSTTVMSSTNPSATGEPVTFTATVTNSAGSAAAPTGAVQFVVDSSNFGSPVTLTPASSNSSTAVSQSTSTLSVAGSPHPVTANYVNGADGNFINSSGALPGGQVVNSTTIAPPGIAKAFSPSGIQPNGVSTLTITLTNPSFNSVALQGVSFTDFLPAHVVVAGSPNLTDSCGGTAIAFNFFGLGIVSLSGGSIAVNGSCAVSVSVTSANTGSYVNTTGAVNSSNGGAGGTASATLNVAFAPTISKLFLPDTITAGSTTSLSFAINNPNSNSTPPNNDMVLTGIQFTDSLPAGVVVASPNQLNNNCDGTVTAVPGSGSITLVGGDLGAAVPLRPRGIKLTNSRGGANGVKLMQQPSANGSCFISVEVTAPAAGTFNNTTGAISANESGPGQPSNTATLTVSAAPIVNPPTVSKAFGATSLALNGTTSLTFTITNPNSSTQLINIRVDDTLPAGLTLANPIAASGSCLADGGGITGTSGGQILSMAGLTLPAAQSCSYSVNVNAVLSGNWVNTTNPITAAFLVGDIAVGITGGSATASVIVEFPPSIGKAFNPALIAPNGVSTLSFTIINPAINLAPETGVAFTDTLPGTLVVATPSGATGNCGGGTFTAVAGSNSISLSGGTIPVNSFCVVSVNVTGAVAGAYTNTTGPVSSTNGGTGNTASANLNVKPANLIITKTHPDFDRREMGAPYTITVSNDPTAGPTLGTVTVFDTLPDNQNPHRLVPVSLSGTGWSCTLATLTCTRSDVLAPGASYPPITLTVNVPQNIVANVVNSATVFGGGDPNTHTANDPTHIGPPLNIAPMDPNLSAANLVVPSGGSGSFIFDVESSKNLGRVVLSCSGLPMGGACNFSPAQTDQLSTIVTMTITVPVHSAAASTLPLGPGGSTYALLFPALCLVGIVLLGGRKTGKKNWKLRLLGLAGVAMLLAVVSCGGAPQSMTPPQPLATYPVTVTASAGSVTSSTTVTLNVR